MISIRSGETALTDTCWVYAMQAGKFVKIGVATNVERRLCNIDGGPLEVSLIAKRRMPNRTMALEAEKALHRDLKRYHHRREWFIVSSETARRKLSRRCAEIRLAGAIEARKPLEGTITLAELLEPKIPRHMKSKGLLEQWQWRRARAAAYYDAIERKVLEVA